MRGRKNKKRREKKKKVILKSLWNILIMSLGGFFFLIIEVRSCFLSPSPSPDLTFSYIHELSCFNSTFTHNFCFRFSFSCFRVFWLLSLLSFVAQKKVKKIYWSFFQRFFSLDISPIKFLTFFLLQDSFFFRFFSRFILFFPDVVFVVLSPGSPS